MKAHLRAPVARWLGMAVANQPLPGSTPHGSEYPEASPLGASLQQILQAVPSRDLKKKPHLRHCSSLAWKDADLFFSLAE